MRQSVPAIIAVLTISFFSCKKDAVQAPQQISSAVDNSLQTEKRTTYLPLTKGCSWNYNVISNGKTKLSTVTMLKGTVLINEKNYRPAKLKQGKSLDTIYYVKNVNDYYMYTNQGGDGNSVSLEMLFLKDNVDAGTTWTTTGSKLNGLDAKCITTVKEKGISMTINGVEYTNIIHTQVDVQVKILFAYASAVVQDFYFAQGVGIVKNITNQKLGDVSVTTTEITGYHIQ